ncbi:MAG: hypothetical protein ACFFCQ_13565 [Promethearchaeota archaeon]
MFFLSKKGSEIAQSILESEKKWYKKFLKELRGSFGLFIHDEGPPIEDPEYVTLPFNSLLEWAKKDWKPLLDSLKGKSWTIIWVTRGGLILLDSLESSLDDFLWTYLKPKTDLLPYEDESVYEEYTDPVFDDKLAEHSGSKTSFLLIDDIITDDGSNLEAVIEHAHEVAEELDIEVDKIVTVCLLTKIRTLGEMPIYGVLTDYNADIKVAWGNDMPSGLDMRDFLEEKETIDDH